MLVSFVVYAPGSLLFVKARREQGRAPFEGTEPAILAVSVALAIVGVVAIAAGWISI
jgi:arginine:ornithine antiporter/lysine permease